MPDATHIPRITLAGGGTMQAVPGAPFRFDREELGIGHERPSIRPSRSGRRHRTDRQIPADVSKDRFRSAAGEWRRCTAARRLRAHSGLWHPTLHRVRCAPPRFSFFWSRCPRQHLQGIWVHSVSGGLAHRNHPKVEVRCNPETSKASVGKVTNDTRRSKQSLPLLLWPTNIIRH